MLKQLTNGGKGSCLMGMFEPKSPWKSASQQSACTWTLLTVHLKMVGFYKFPVTFFFTTIKSYKVIVMRVQRRSWRNWKEGQSFFSAPGSFAGAFLLHLNLSVWDASSLTFLPSLHSPVSRVGFRSWVLAERLKLDLLASKVSWIYCLNKSILMLFWRIRLFF